jgi:hypothetical protein
MKSVLRISGSKVIMLRESKVSPPSERDQGASILRSCEPERLEGDHHFSGSERNLGGELSGERFFYFFRP